VARLATAGDDGRPHVVPIVFAVVGDTIYNAVDHKRKRTTALRRLANVAANPRVAVLADPRLRRGLGRALVGPRRRIARVLEPGDPEGHGSRVAALIARYAPYRDRPPEGRVLAIDVERWSGWSAAGS